MLQIRNIKKEYKTGTLIQKALDSVSLTFRENEFVAVLGPSGSGKTTLLNIIGGLDHADSGELIIDGIQTERYKSRDWDAYRNHSVGFIFQSYNLIPHQTILRNVELSMTLSGVSREERIIRAKEELDKVGLGDQTDKKPAQLSGGQMQRVAIARALVNKPTIVLADEPTGALDSDTGEQVMELLREVAEDHLVIMVTHNPDLAQRYATRIIRLKDGKVVSDTNPFSGETGGDASSEEVVKTETDTMETPSAEGEKKTEKTGKKEKKPSMSFLTALSLSVSNLLSKKTRTLLVAFAASIGITGIALILSLSTGAHAYIGKMEENALSEYPLQISSSSYSMEESMLTLSRYDGMEDIASGETDDGTVNEISLLGGMLSGVRVNDLGALKRWFDSEYSDISEYTRSVSYRYGISPQVYIEEKNGYRQVNPDQTMNAMGISMNDSLTGMMSIWQGNDAFCMLPEKKELYEEADAYTLLAGHWPEKDTECVVVLFPNGDVPDILLYTMGLKDAEKLNQVISDVMDGNSTETEMEDAGEYKPEDFLGIRFRVLPANRRFTYSEELGRWLDCASDEAAMKELLDQAEELEIVGVTVPESGSSVGILQYGRIEYRPELMERLIEEAADSGVVKAQLEDPGTDVLTGAEFGDQDSVLTDEMERFLDFMEIHPENIPDAVSIDWDRAAEYLNKPQHLTAKQTVRIIRELSRTGESPTLKEVFSEWIPSLLELIKIDEKKLGDVISMEMDEAQLQEMYAAQASASQTSFKGNLNRFGYADFDSPTMITIYPKDFQSKEQVIAILDAYNEVMEENGYEDKVITYNDYVGSLMSSVTTIIDVITYVLIAFVAVSLIVSSIMIGIITYISVLERRKEIGILRAIGASRYNITEVFNAETFIIGILAGTFGIIMTLIMLVPINSVIHSLTDEPVKAFLPPASAVVLVFLCVILTLIGGFIPARSASRQDPVAALRSE